MTWDVDKLPIGPGLVKRHGRLDVNLADPRRTDPSLTVPAPHAYTHGVTGDDPVTVAMTQVTGLVAEFSDVNDAIDLKADLTDPRFTDDRDPNAHATSHQDGGSDELALAISQITGLQAILDTFTVLPAWDATDVGKVLTVMPDGGLAWVLPGEVPLTYNSPTLYDTASTYEEEFYG